MQRVIYVRRPQPSRDQHGLQQQLERAFQHALVASMHEHEVWHPPADVSETESTFIVRVELAGMRDAEIAITIEDHCLRIEGQRPEQRDERLRYYHQMGISYGAFVVEVFLPRPVDDKRVTARYDDGFLFVELPRARF